MKLIKNILGYEVCEFNKEGIKNRGLIFYQHGYTGSKEDVAGRMEILANDGFKVVAIDAYGHGSRMEKPLPRDKDYKIEMDFYYKIIVETCNDYINLFDNHYRSTYETFSMIGESMGGQIVYMVGCKKKELKNIGAIVGSPSLIDYGYEDLVDNNATLNYALMLDHLKEYDAFYNIEKFIDKQTYMLCGSKDEVVPKKWSLQFKNILGKKYSSSNVVYKEVDRNHWIPDEDLRSMFDYISDNF